MRIDDGHLQHLLRWVQDGVVSRRQSLELGGTEADIRRMLRRRDLTPIQRGVMVNHTGTPTATQHHQAAVLAAWPAALGFESALGMPTPDGRIRLVVPTGGNVAPIPGARIQSIVDFDERVDQVKSPPRVRFANAAVDVAAERDEAEAFTVLTDALWTRRTTIDELLGVVASRTRLRNRTSLEQMLADLRDGTCSFLERGYLHLVERPHGLPRMDRQAKDVLAGRTIYRDGEYATYKLVIELDGIAYHRGSRARASDSIRDLETLAARDEVTIRLTPRQVFREGCRSGHLIGRILRRRGWPGRTTRCPACR